MINALNILNGLLDLDGNPPLDILWITSPDGDLHRDRLSLKRRKALFTYRQRRVNTRCQNGDHQNVRHHRIGGKPADKPVFLQGVH